MSDWVNFSKCHGFRHEKSVIQNTFSYNVVGSKIEPKK